MLETVNPVVTVQSTDTWGRLENDSAVTASNVAKYDALHGMAVFKDHPPTHYSQVRIFSPVHSWTSL